MIWLMIDVTPRPGDDHTAAGRPDAVPHFGHASRPWSASTRLATAICCSLDAAAGLPTPPYLAQVAGLNCSPPYMPLPVFACQLPPDSHCATASQFGVGAASATPLDKIIDAAANAPNAADVMTRLQIFVMSRISPDVSKALPIRISREMRHLSHRDW